LKVLIDLNHPAHFHLFHKVYLDLVSHGNEVLFTAKNKDVLLRLLKANNINPIILQKGVRKKGLTSAFLGVLKRDYGLFKVIKDWKPDLLAGTSISITHVGRITGIPSLYFGEDGYKAVPLSYKIAYPFAKHLVAPSCTDVSRKYDSKKIGYNGYHELAYLDPEIFTPDENIPVKYGISPEETFFIVRFSALEAHHDIGIKGISNSFGERIIKRLGHLGKVIITSEKPVRDSLEDYRIPILPHDMHHIMAYARLLIGDSQTMCAESAVLGVPSIRYSDFVGKLMYLEELEKEYGLTYGIRPGNEAAFFNCLEKVLNTDPDIFQSKRRIMLKEKIKVKNFFVWLLENYPESTKSIEKDNSVMGQFRKVDIS